MKTFIKSLLILSLPVYLFACAKGRYAATNKIYKKQVERYADILEMAPLHDSLSTAAWVGTTNFNMRKPNYVIIHHTAQKSCDETLKTFTVARSQVSAHYVICKDGTVYHMLNDYLRAWHAGVGKWGNNTDINSSSIGIEIDNNGFEPFTEEQLTSLLKVLGGLKRAYNIPVANFIGHSDIAPTRKVDPNVTFPWKRLADEGFGLWWSDTTGVAVPENFNAMQALRLIGYDTKDSAAAVASFKRKFEQQDKNSALTEDDKKVIFSLFRKVE